MNSRPGIGRMAVAVIIVVVLVLAVAGAIALSSQGQSTTSPSQILASTSQTSATQTSRSSSSSSPSTTSASSTTQSSSVVPAGCVFSAPQPAAQATSTVTLNFKGCLASGTSGTYLIAALDPDGLDLSGTITAQYPIQVTIGSAKVSNLFTSSGQLYTANNTMSVNLTGLGLSFLPQNGYGVTIRNEGGQNNTVTMTIQLDDMAG
ncbi:MAG: hypothetical protein OK455_06825 [Thaumarchaeota archaeon]|nr:hypothetical protein [Nitrososphaerota archaeon]